METLENKPTETTETQEAMKPLTILEVKTNYINIPHIFFERKLSPMQFGMVVHGFLRQVGLGVAGDGSSPVLGYAFCGALSPVEIAVYAYLCYKPQALASDIAKNRKLPKRLIERTLGSLEELGMFENVEYGGSVSRKMVTLEDLVAADTL